MEEFTKADLRDGYVVTYRNYCARGPIERRVVSNGCKFLSDIGTTNEASRLDFFDNGLKSYDDNSLDIIRVECPVCGILWEREGFETVKEDDAVESSGVTLHGYSVKIGDKVFSSIHGDGVVDNFDMDEYPICVRFNNDIRSFNADGYFCGASIYPSLGWTEEYDVRKLAQTKPPKKVKKWFWLIGTPGGFKLSMQRYSSISLCDKHECGQKDVILSKIEESMIEVDE